MRGGLRPRARTVSAWRADCGLPSVACVPWGGACPQPVGRAHALPGGPGTARPTGYSLQPLGHSVEHCIRSHASAMPVATVRCWEALLPSGTWCFVLGSETAPPPPAGLTCSHEGVGVLFSGLREEASLWQGGGRCAVSTSHPRAHRAGGAKLGLGQARVLHAQAAVPSPLALCEDWGWGHRGAEALTCRVDLGPGCLSPISLGAPGSCARGEELWGSVGSQRPALLTPASGWCFCHRHGGAGGLPAGLRHVATADATGRGPLGHLTDTRRRARGSAVRQHRLGPPAASS